MHGGVKLETGNSNSFRMTIEVAENFASVVLHIAQYAILFLCGFNVVLI